MPFVKKRITQYIKDTLSQDSLSTMTDVDDLYVDSLKEQAMELGISLDEEIPISPSKEKSVKKKFNPKQVPQNVKKEVD